MTASSPSGPTKIAHNTLILLKKQIPCGDDYRSGDSNGLLAGVPHDSALPPGWWLIPSMLCGALVWAYIAAGWL